MQPNHKGRRIMKFLLFNITVLTALAYLFFDNGEMHKISDKIQKSSFDAIEKVKTLSKPIQEKLIENQLPRDKYKVGKSPHEQSETSSSRLPYPAETGSQLTTDQNKENRSSSELPPLPDPEFVEIREKPSPKKPQTNNDKNKNPKQLETISIAKEEEGQTFMSRAERHKELQKLAQSAEDLFLNRMIK